MLQICVSWVTVSFIMPSLLLHAHSNCRHNISCAIDLFLQQQIFLTESCNPTLGTICCSTCACYFITSSSDWPTHFNKACHLLSPAFVPGGHSGCKKSDSTIFTTSVQPSKMTTDSATSVCIAHANGRSLICQVPCLNTIALHLILPFVLSFTKLCLSRHSSLPFVLLCSLSY